MKKITLALTAISLVALVGVALAFKANRALDKVYIHASTDTKADRCTLQYFQHTTFPKGTPVAVVASTTALTKDCKLINVYDGE